MAAHLLFLFFLLFPTTTHPSPLRYQTLHVGTLPSLDDLPSPLDDEKTLLPVGATQPNSSSLHLSLLHVDSLLHLLPSTAPKLTPQSLLRLRLLRDASRVASLTALLPPNSSARRPPINSFNSSVVSGLSHGSGEYFTRLGIGTPPSPSLLVLDTGSDVVWSQCAPCTRCYPQSDPLFTPSRSSTFSPLPCSSRLCHRLDDPSCHPSRRSCLYRVAYGDGSSTAGDFSTETFTFRGHLRLPRVAFGCGRDNEGLFVAASGLLGLGRGPLSFPSQASGRLRRRAFSYCLVDRTSSTSTSSSPRRRRISSTLIFGNSAVPTSAVFTRMVANPKLETFYYVELTGVSVGGARVRSVLASDLKLDPATGRGGVIVDSGTSVTRLARASYVAIRDAFRDGATGLKTAPGFSLFDTCYDLSGLTEVKVPTVAMHFRGEAGGEVAVSLPAANYMIPVDSGGVFCFAFAGTDSGISIIGNIQQQGFRVVFDGDRGRVGFAPGSC